MTIPDPYARRMFHGKLLDNATIAALEMAEEKLGYELTIVQGVGGAAASAGTHLGRDGEGGRAADLAAWDHARKVKVLRDLGFAAAYRPDLPGVWGEHVHAGLFYGVARYNERGAAPALVEQLRDFDRGLNMLANNAPDPNPYRPDPRRQLTPDEYRATFEAPPTRPKRTPVTRARDRIVEAMQAIGQAAALLDDTDPGRTRARAEIDDLRATRRGLRDILERMPTQ